MLGAWGRRTASVSPRQSQASSFHARSQLNLPGAVAAGPRPAAGAPLTPAALPDPALGGRASSLLRDPHGPTPMTRRGRYTGKWALGAGGTPAENWAGRGRAGLIQTAGEGTLGHIHWPGWLGQWKGTVSQGVRVAPIRKEPPGPNTRGYGCAPDRTRVGHHAPRRPALVPPCVAACVLIQLNPFPKSDLL